MVYTVEKINSTKLTRDIYLFIYEAGLVLNKQENNKYRWKGFQLEKFCDEQHLWVCFRDLTLVGFLAASLYESFFDPDQRILYQNLLYALPYSRASHHLLREFIDFGQTNANHTVSVIGQNTNIKARSLERLGFTKLEENYIRESTLYGSSRKPDK